MAGNRVILTKIGFGQGRRPGYGRACPFHPEHSRAVRRDDHPIRIAVDRVRHRQRLHARIIVVTNVELVINRDRRPE